MWGALPPSCSQRSQSLGVDDVVDLHLDAVGVRLVLDEVELRRVLIGGAEQPFARAEQDRELEEVVAVDQTRIRETRPELGTAVNGNHPAVARFEGSDIVEGTQDRGWPARVVLGERG